MHRAIAVLLLLVLLFAGQAHALDRPWISAVYFYWYTWDYHQELGGWMQGVYNQPLQGYYDSRTYLDNLKSLHVASEWGLTHCFMDYWGPGWKADTDEPRESVVMRAAEALQQAGYDLHMGFYQDGDDFDMQQFAANLDEGRDFWFYIHNYARSPAMPLLDGKPVNLIYGRNGLPKSFDEPDGFRAYLRDKYKTLDALNGRWGTSFGDWSEIEPAGGKGWPRAETIKYNYRRWAEEWAKLDARAQQEYGLPGLRVSFDAGYGPFRGWGYSDFARVLGGPHSYGGIFGNPDDSDTARFIQAAVAKRYNTVFFDHFKNFYNDTDIRIPGLMYSPHPLNFDRFWVGTLARYSEALLHLSWNEWWEGSNLEPCLEFGKTYPQKNLLYATIMKQCFPSIRDWNRGAKVAVLLNDWHWLAGGRYPEDIYGSIRALRRLGVRFDLLPDDFVTADELGRFDVVIAPTGLAGLGVNAAGEDIGDVLRRWVEVRDDADRRLITSAHEPFHEWLGLKPDAPEGEGAQEPGPDMTIFVDVGVEGDDRFLVEGCSGREDWGRLPKDKFGAQDESLTVRWAPAAGETTTFLLPMSPHRDHALRLAGRTLASNGITVLIDGVEAGRIEIGEGGGEYELAIPKDVIGGRRFGEVVLRYDRKVLPKELDPQRFPSESRVCDLAIDWLQFSTANIGRTTDQNYELPEARVRWLRAAPGALRGRKAELPYRPHARLAVPEGAEVWSRYEPDGAPRDVVVPVKGGMVWYCNGLIGAEDGEPLQAALESKWADLKRPYRLKGQTLMAAMLEAGPNTRIAVAFNEQPASRRTFVLELPVYDQPVAEVKALSKDGLLDRDVSYEVSKGMLRIEDSLRYYAVIEICTGDIALTTPRLVLHPGETQTVKLSLKSLVRRPVSGTVGLVPHLPSLTAEPVEFKLPPRATEEVELAITARPDVDWGEKTVVFEVARQAGEPTYFWRRLMVERNAELHPRSRYVDAAETTVELQNRPNDYIANAAAEDVVLELDGRRAAVPRLESGQSAEVRLPGRIARLEEPMLMPRIAELVYDRWGRPERAALPLFIAGYPREYDRWAGAIAPLLVFSARPQEQPTQVLHLDLDQVKLPGKTPRERLYVGAGDGRPLPSQLSASRRFLSFVVDLPARGARTLNIMATSLEGPDGVSSGPPSGPAPAEPATDLSLESTNLGTGEGKVTVSTSHYTLTLDEAHGGTVTQFESARTGRDYATGTCGAAYGSWGHYPPDVPRTNTVEYIGEEHKVRQDQAPGRLEVLAAGPVEAIVKASWSDGKIKATQEYHFFAHQPWFAVTAVVHPGRLGDVDEIIAFDFRLQRHELSKTYPNFVGIVNALGQEQPHFGWRETDFIPPVATAMTPDKFEESVSLIVNDAEGCDRWRQGIWPETRPQAGPAKYCWMEIGATQIRPARVTCHVFLHQGHQTVAQRLADELKQPPLLIVPRKFKWRPGIIQPEEVARPTG